MTLNDVRKFAIRNRSKVGFPLAGGLSCVVDHQGVAGVPGLKEPPSFNLEVELKTAASFTVEPVPVGKEPVRVSHLDRVRMEAQVLAATGAGAAAHDDHDE